MIDYKRETGLFLFGMCLRQCVDQDIALKPLFCTVVCGIGSYYGVKSTYQAASTTYDQYVKPGLKSFFSSRRFGKDLPGLPPQK